MTCESCGDKPKKCNKDFTKAVIEIDNPEQITLMRKVVIPASMGDDTTVPPVVGKYHNVLLYYEANSKSYLYSSDGIPTQLVNGVTDYEAAVNLPQINGVTLLGDKSAADLELADAPMVITVADGNTSWSGADTAEDVYDFFLNKGKVNIVFNGGGNYAYEIASAAYIPEEEKMMCTLAVATIAAGETAEFEGNALFGTMTLYTANKAIDVSQIELQPKLYIADFTGLDLNYNELSGVPATNASIGMVKSGDGLEVASDGTLSISEIEQYAHFFDTVADMKVAANLATGDYARTGGFYTINDGGGALYKITDAGTANEMDIIAIGDLYATLIKPTIVIPEIYGAYGDNTHDDSSSINRMLDQNNVVNFLNKTYKASNLSINNHTIRGNETTISSNTTDPILVVEGDIDISDIILDKNNQDGKIVSIEKVEDTTLDGRFVNITFLNTTQDYPAIRATHISNLIVENSKFNSIKANALHLTYVKKLNVNNNIFTNIGNLKASNRTGSACLTGYSSNVNITNNICENITDSCFYCAHSFCEMVNISYNQIRDCQKDGIKNQTTGRKTIISGNILESIYANAIIVPLDQEETIISDNIINGCCIAGGVESASKESGIRVIKSKNTIINNNIVKNIGLEGKRGIYINYTGTGGVKSTTVSNNLIDGVSGEGIFVNNTNYANVHGNIISNCCLNMTTAKTPLQFTDSTGNINSNTIQQPSVLSGSAIKLSQITLQILKGTPNCFSNGQSITLYYYDSGDTIHTQTTTVVSYDASTHTLTVNDDINGDVDAEIFYNLDVSSIQYLYSMRFSGTCNFCSIGNHLGITSGYFPNVSENTTLLPVRADYFTLNIRDTA